MTTPKHFLFSALFMALSAAALGQRTNPKLIAALDRIATSDQQYRSLHPKNQEEDKENMKKQDLIDAENLKKIAAMITRYGYPGKSLVGEKYKSTALMVIQHNDTEARIKYLPILQQAAKKGEVNASSVAIVEDRLLTDQGKLQRYGSQLHETKDGVKVYPIEDETQVNIRRKAIGMPPLEVYLKQWNISYQVPDKNHQNPPSLYYTIEKPSSPVELIGSQAQLYQQVSYPKTAQDNAITGKVTVELTVDKDGIPKNLSVVKSLGYGCDEEAIRVLKLARFSNTSGEDHEIRMQVPFPPAPVKQ